MEASTELMLGIVFSILGLSFIFHTKPWMRCFEIIQGNGSASSLSLGICTLVLSSLILVCHSTWEGNFVFITIIGIIGLIEASAYLIFPNALGYVFSIIRPIFHIFIKSAGVLFLIFSTYIFIHYKVILANIKHDTEDIWNIPLNSLWSLVSL